jgi:hypothetical protein
MLKKTTAAMFLLAIATITTIAADKIYVDNVKGNDRNDGSQDMPFKTLRKAVSSLSPGMTLFMVPNQKPYKDSLKLSGLPAKVDAPITIDGQNSVLNGLKDTRKMWVSAGEELYKREAYKNIQVARHFMVIDRKLQRMGIYAKLRRPKLKSPDKIIPGEWTYVKNENSLYLKVPAGKTINDISLFEPSDISNSGVMIIKSSNIIIKNLTVEYFKNDGFNMHGSCKNIYLENITAKYCGDDGVSAHEDSEIKVKNFISIGNVSAICHVNDCISDNENILIKDSYGTDIYLLNKSNRFKNLLVESSGFVWFKKGSLNIENALFTNPENNPRAYFRIDVKDAKFKNVMVKDRKIINKNSDVKIFSKDSKDFDDSFITENPKIFSAY